MMDRRFRLSSKAAKPAMLACVMAFNLALGIVPAHAQSGAGGVSEQDVKQLAQQQFEAMYKHSIADVEARLNGSSTTFKPFAVVTDTIGKVRTVRIKQTDEMPDPVALELMRRSLKVMANNGRVGATTVIYTAKNPDEKSNAENVIVFEMEHIFGPSVTELVPYTKADGKTRFGKSASIESERKIFTLKAKEAEEE